MKLFINDILIDIVDQESFFPDRHYDLVFRADQSIGLTRLHGYVLVEEGPFTHIDNIISLMEIKKLKKVHSITYVTANYKETKDFIKSQFKVVKAAGGLVTKKNKVLLIYRFGRWDLPKGKLEKDEKTQAGALREVEEECNIQVECIEKLCSTWHTYLQDGRKVLKKTTWYWMNCLNDEQLAPQTEEGIQDVRWMNQVEYTHALQQSYGSIIEVFRKFEVRVAEITA